MSTADTASFFFYVFNDRCEVTVPFVSFFFSLKGKGEFIRAKDASMGPGDGKGVAIY